MVPWAAAVVAAPYMEATARVMVRVQAHAYQRSSATIRWGGSDEPLNGIGIEARVSYLCEPTM